MSGWTTSDTEAAGASGGPSAAAAAGERERLTPSSPTGRRKSKLQATLGAKTLLMIWTLFLLGFVLILCAAIAYSSGFTDSGTGCLLAGLGCLVAASLWQWRVSSSRLELGRSAGYPHMPAPGAFNIQEEAEAAAAAGFH